MKKFKQELIFLPIMLVIIEVFRRLVYSYFPDTAMFDRGSELETYLTRVWQIVWITCGCWVLLRVTFPTVHKELSDMYNGFGKIDLAERRSIALKMFFCFFFGLIFLMSGRASTTVSNHNFSTPAESFMRAKLVDTITSQLYVRELTGKNDGVDVEKYLSYVGQKSGAAWCAAFTSYNLNAVGVSAPPNPKSAWSPAFASRHIVWTPGMQKQHRAKAPPQPGDCFTLYFPKLGRVGHVGFIVGEQGQYFITIEGNTGTSGSREGSGVHKYKRAKQKVYTVTNYITPHINEKDRYHNTFVLPLPDGIMSMETHAEHRHKYRTNSDKYRENGFAGSYRYNLPVQGGQHCAFGLHRSINQCAGAYFRIAQDKINALHKQWKGYGGLCLQGAGENRDPSGEKNNGAYCYCEGQAAREGNGSNQRSPVHTQMG